MTMLQPGQMLGAYKIISQIGQGGMATVYKAYQSTMDRYVALKVLSFAFVERQEFIERFRNEARLIARLEHPNILPVYDFGDSDGIPFLVMRFLEAGTLKERLEAGPITLPEVDRIFTQLAEALAYAHESGIIHRDIKPSNAMLDKRGQLFLTDFGIAKLLEGSPEFTATGAITGTPAYMSPEQAQGKRLDHRSDIYSLAIVLHEMLAGRVPFEAETPLAVIIKHIQEPLVPISVIKPDIHPSIERVLLKALVKDPEARYQSVAEFLEAWQGALEEMRQSQSFTDRPEPVYGAMRPDQQATVLDGTAIDGSSEAATFRTEPPATSPIERKRPAWVTWGLAVVGGLLIIAVAFFAFDWINDQRGQDEIDLPTPLAGEEATKAPDFSGLPVESTGQPVAADYAWTTWQPANTVQVIRYTAQNLLAAGPGGVTVWKPDGSSYQRITIRDGIPGANIMDLLIDGKDLWVATQEGLGMWNEVDGWRYFDSDSGLDSDFVTSLAPVGDEIWVGTAYAGDATTGLQRYDYERFSSITFPSADEDDPVMAGVQTVSYNVTGIAPDNDNGAWIATERGIAHWNSNLQAWRLYTAGEGLPEAGGGDQDFTAIFFDEENDTLWAGTDSGVVYRFVNEEPEFVTNLAEDDLYTVTEFVIGSDDQLWVAAHGGAAQIDRDSLAVTYLSFSEERFPAYLVLSAASTPDGRLVFGTQANGLYFFDGQTFSNWYIPGLPVYEHFDRIMPAADGRLWFAQSFEDHYDIFNPATGSWEFAPEQDFCCLLTWDGEDAVYGGWDGLVILKADGSQVVLNDSTGLPTSVVNDAAVQEAGVIWVGTEAGLVEVKNGVVSAVYTGADGLPSEDVRVVRVTQDGSVWAGTDRGISRRYRDGRWEHYIAGKDFDEYMELVTDVIDDGEGGFWFAVYGDGLYHLVQGKLSPLRFGTPGVLLPSARLTSLAVGPDGSLLIGTEQAGLVRLAEGTWNVASTRSGLSHPSVYDIYVSPDGSVWLATGSGVSRISP